MSIGAVPSNTMAVARNEFASEATRLNFVLVCESYETVISCTLCNSEASFDNKRWIERVDGRLRPQSGLGLGPISIQSRSLKLFWDLKDFPFFSLTSLTKHGDTVSVVMKCRSSTLDATDALIRRVVCGRSSSLTVVGRGLSARHHEPGLVTCLPRQHRCLSYQIFNCLKVVISASYLLCGRRTTVVKSMVMVMMMMTTMIDHLMLVMMTMLF